MPTTVVLPILALLWIAVLTPIVVRRVRDYRAVDRIDTFHDSLHLLDRSSEAFSARRPELVLLRPVSGVDDAADPYVDEDSGACFDRVPVRSGLPSAGTPARRRRRAAALRRRNLLLGLGLSAVVVTGVAVEPFCTTVNNDGTIGYYSVFYVKADSPYKTLEELKGKNLGLVDPNSTSGNNVPRFALNKMKVNPETFFARVTYTGSHENALIALNQGTVDVAANWWNSDDDSNLTRMATKNLLKKDDFRIIYKSDLIPNSPYAYLASLPPDLKAAIAKAFFDAPTKAKAAFDKLSDGKDKEFVKVDAKYYEPVVELIKFIDQLRKQKS